MEAYVTRKEFENVLKELRRLECFLIDIFGNKFADFQRRDGSEIVKSPPQVIGGVVGGRMTNSTGSGSSGTAVSVRRVSVYPPSSRGEPQPRVAAGGGDDGIRKRIPSTETDDEVVEIDPLNMSEDPSMPIVTSTRSLSNSASSKTSPSQAPVPQRVILNRPPSVDSTPNPAVPYLPPTVPITLHHLHGQPTPGSTPTTGPTLMIVEQNNQYVMARACSGPSELPQLVPINPEGLSPQNSILFSSLQSNTPIMQNNKSPGPGVTPAAEGKPPKRKRVRKTPSSLPSIGKPPSSLQRAKAPTPSPPTATPEIIQCEHCQLFVYSSQLDEHMKNHSILDLKGNSDDNNAPIFQQPQTCPFCKVKCPDFQGYENHFKKVHSNNKEIPCPMCGKGLQPISRLRRHMTIHKNLKFTCEACGKCYNRRDNLTAHVKTHVEGVEPSIFYCGYCRNAFSSRDGRDRHLRTSHPNESCDPNANSPSDMASASSSSPPESAGNSGTTETISCDDGRDSATQFEYEGEEEEDVIELN